MRYTDLLKSHVSNKKKKGKKAEAKEGEGEKIHPHVH